MIERKVDVGSLRGRVPEGVLNRVIKGGGVVPEKGPGSFSVPNALRGLAKTDQKGSGDPQTLQGRRQWNSNHQVRGH